MGRSRTPETIYHDRMALELNELHRKAELGGQVPESELLFRSRALGDIIVAC